MRFSGFLITEAHRHACMELQASPRVYRTLYALVSIITRVAKFVGFSRFSRHSPIWIFPCFPAIFQSYPQDCLLTPLGREYNGMMATTASGVACKLWNTTSYNIAGNFPDMTSYHSYCRNPDFTQNMPGPWCVRSSDGVNEACLTIPMCGEFILRS